MKTTSLMLVTMLFHNALNAQWYWQNPQPQGNEVNSVFFLNSNIGWAVGDNGTILRTSDGGQNWKASSSPSASDLGCVVFTSNLRGFAAGRAGVFLVTVDGGITWTQRGTNDSNRHYGRIRFVDSNIGWRVYHQGLMKTTDGGESWFNLNLTISDFRDFFFVSPQIGWATGWTGYGVALSKTTDGGATWVPQSYGANSIYPNAMYFLNENVGWSVAGSILKTTDGGNSWVSQLAASISGSLQSVSFVDANNGLVVGYNGGICRTTDGGATWLTVRNLSTYSLNSVTYVNTGLALAVGEYGTMMRSTDGGKNWVSQRSAAASDWYALHFLSENEGWVVGEMRTIAHTGDGGKQWNAQTKGSVFDEDLYDVQFRNSQVGFACGEDLVLMKTTNGGSSWTWSRVTNANVGSLWDLGALFFVNDSVGWVVASYVSLSSTILKTSDRGNTWTSQLTASVVLDDIQFLDAQVGFATGTSGKVYTTSNGGANWTLRNDLVGNKVHSCSDKNIWIASSDTIRMSSDGGATWLKKALPYSRSKVLNLFVIDPLSAWIVKEYENPFYTTNGGNTWYGNFKPVPFPKGIMRASFFFDKSTGWIAGADGSIFSNRPSSVGTFVERTKDDVSSAWDLTFSCYPNPFNPRTTIRYELPNEVLVNLKVFNVLGEEVATLVNRSEKAGVYSFQFDASNLASGIYFCRLQAGDFVETKKMILLR